MSHVLGEEEVLLQYFQAFLESVKINGVLKFLHKHGPICLRSPLIMLDHEISRKSALKFLCYLNYVLKPDLRKLILFKHEIIRCILFTTLINQDIIL